MILAENHFQYNETGIENLFTHKIFQKQFWYSGTCIIHMVIVMESVVFALLLFSPMLESKYKIYTWYDSKDGKMKVISNNKGLWLEKALCISSIRIH